MQYSFKRASLISFAVYGATFVVGMIAGVVSGQDMSSMGTISDVFWYVGMVAAVVISALFTFWYFKSKAIIPSAKSGLFFGLTVVAISTVLDIIFFSLGNANGANVNLAEFYGDFRFWIILALVLGATTFVGYKKRVKTVY